jgi:GT2 family glycosyltransferase
MNLLYIIYTHNREAILRDCLTTLFKNNTVKPDRVLVIDDHASPANAGLRF